MITGIVLFVAFSKSPQATDSSQVAIASPPKLPDEVEAQQELSSKIADEPALPSTPTEPLAIPAETNVEDLLRRQQIALREDIVKRVDEAMKRVQKVGYGHVVVGQVKLQGNASPRDVIAQTEILEDGFFVEAVATAGAPLYFWFPGYDRLDVVPNGQPGSLENLGELKLVRSSKPGGVVRGIVLENGSEIPNQLEVKLVYSVPSVNQCVQDKNELVQVEKKLLEKLEGLSARAEVKTDSKSGEFAVLNLPELQFELRLRTPSGGWVTVMEAASGEESNLALISPISNAGADMVQDLTGKPLAKDGKALVQRIVAKLPSGSQDLKYFQQRLQTTMKLVDDQRKKNGERSGVVLVGKIAVEGKPLEGSRVAAQMPISDGGYFCDAISPGRPIGFRLHGYEPIDYVPQGSHDGVEYCGTLRMTKTPDTKIAAVRGSVVLEGGPGAATIRLYCSEAPDNAVVGFGGGAGFFNRNFGASVPPKVTKTGTEFEVNGLSPIHYSFVAKCAGYADQWRTVRLSPNESLTMPAFTLFRTRNIDISYFVSPTCDFANAVLKHTTQSTDGGRWRAVEDPAVYRGFGADLNFSQYGNTILAINSYLPTAIADLGEVSLQQGRFVKSESIVRPRNFSHFTLRPGHVYLYKSEWWKHWVLFRVDSISLKQIEGN